MRDLGSFLLTTSQLIVYRGNPREGYYFPVPVFHQQNNQANEEQDIFCGSFEKGRLECRSDGLGVLISFLNSSLEVFF